MKKNFVVVLLVVFLLSMLTCEAESEPTIIPATTTADVFGKCDAVDFLLPNQGEVLFVSLITDIVSESTNWDTDKITMSTNNVYIGYDYDSPNVVVLNYYNDVNELVLITYDSKYNALVYGFYPMELTPTQFAIFGDLMIADLYDEWRELDADVLEYLFEAVNTAISE